VAIRKILFTVSSESNSRTCLILPSQAGQVQDQEWSLTRSLPVPLSSRLPYGLPRTERVPAGSRRPLCQMWCGDNFSPPVLWYQPALRSRDWSTLPRLRSQLVFPSALDVGAVA